MWRSIISITLLLIVPEPLLSKEFPLDKEISSGFGTKTGYITIKTKVTKVHRLKYVYTYTISNTGNKDTLHFTWKVIDTAVQTDLAWTLVPGGVVTIKLVSDKPPIASSGTATSWQETKKSNLEEYFKRLNVEMSSNTVWLPMSTTIVGPVPQKE